MKDGRRSTRGRFLVTVVAVGGATLTLLLAACGTNDATVTDPPPDPSPSTTATSGSGTGSDPDVLVELATSGGNDGRGIGELLVSPEGEVQLLDPQGGIETATLTAEELGSLVAALNDADFAGAPADPDIDDVCPDAIVYTIIYQQWEVTADTCTIPDEIAPAHDQLQAILARLT
jgi:hypothetical protein